VRARVRIIVLEGRKGKKIRFIRLSLIRQNIQRFRKSISHFLCGTNKCNGMRNHRSIFAVTINSRLTNDGNLIMINARNLLLQDWKLFFLSIYLYTSFISVIYYFHILGGLSIIGCVKMKN